MPRKTARLRDDGDGFVRVRESACEPKGTERDNMLSDGRGCGRHVPPLPWFSVAHLIAGIKPSACVRRVALIVLGSAILTFGVHNIHNVTGITEGGIIGLVLFGNHWLGIPPSVVSPLLDGISYLVAFKVLGGGFLGWSLVASVAVAGAYRLWESLPYMLPDLSGNPLLAAILGALFVGVGVGIVIRQNASAGGDDALALSLSKVTGWRVGRCYLFSDLTVLVLSLSYIPLDKIACSLVTVCMSSALIDVIVGASWDHVDALFEWIRGLRA